MTKPGTNGAAGHASVATMALCYLVALFEGMDLQAAGVAAPRLGPAFQMTSGELGWFFSSSTFGLMLGAVVGGRLSDRLGRKMVLIAAVVVFSLLSVATALAPNVETLLVARFFTGVGLGGALPNLVALAAENASPRQRNLAVGLLYAGLPSGGALASLVTVFGPAEEWRTVFYVGGFAPLAVVPFLIWLLPESRQLRAAQAGRSGGPAPRGVAFALFGEARAARTLLLWSTFFLTLLTMYLLLNWLPTLLVERGLSRPGASLVQTAFNVTGALASVLTGALMDRFSLAKVTAATFGATAVALVLLAVAPAELAVSLVVGSLVGMTILSTQALLYAMAPANYPTEVRGTGVGAAVSIGRLGSAVGPLMAAALLGSGRAPQEVLAVLIPIIVVAGAGTFALAALMARAERRSR